jgi:hypothetical protein
MEQKSDPERKINKGPHLAGDAIVLRKDNSILLITRGEKLYIFK